MRSVFSVISCCTGLLLLGGCVSPQPGDPDPQPTATVVATVTPTATPTALPTPTVVPTPTPISAEIRQEVYQVLMRGALLEGENRTEEAARLYREGLLLAPDSVFLRVRACEALRRLRRYDEALDLATPLVRENNPQLEVQQLLGRLFAHTQDYDRAFPYYLAALEQDPRSIEIRLELVNLYLVTQQIDKAVEQYTTLAEMDPVREAEYRFQAASRLSVMNRYEEALEQFEALAELMDGFSEIYVRMGDLHSLMGQTDAAMEDYLTAISSMEREQDEIPVRQRLAMMYQERGSTQEAVWQYKRIREIDPDNTFAAQYLARHYQREGEYEAALSALDTLLSERPTDYKLNRARCDVLISMGRELEGYRDLLHAFARAMEIGPEPDINLFLLELTRESVMKRLGDLTLFTRFFSTLRNAVPPMKVERLDFARAHVAMVMEQDPQLVGWIAGLLSSLDNARAQNDMERAQRIAAEWQVWFELRRDLIRLGHHDKLIHSLKLTHETYPRQPVIARTLAMAYSDQYKWSQASRVLSQTLEGLSPQHPLSRDVHFQLAAVEEKLGRVSEVETLMRTLIERDPRDAGALNFLGYTFADHDINLEEALDLIQRALRVQPTDGNIIDSLGWVYFRMGRIDDAIRELERAVELEGEHPVILEHLGDAYQRKGRENEARFLWERAMRAGSRFPFEYTPEMQERLQDKLNS